MMNVVEILMLDGCTRAEAEKHIERGAIIFDDFEENFEKYMQGWKIDAEDRPAYEKMARDRTPIADWGVVQDDGKAYYIMYAL